MRHISLLVLFEAVKTIGFAKKQQDNKKNSYLLWEEQFDLHAWEGWDSEVVVYKNQIVELGKAQEVQVRGIFKKNEDLGYVSLPGLVLTLIRNLPVNRNTDQVHEVSLPPSPFVDFETCLWELTDIRYCSSPYQLNQVIKLDPIKRTGY